MQALVALAHDLDRARMVEAGLIGPGAAQRVIDIGDGDDAGADRDVLALETARIAAPLPHLVMAMGNLGGECQFRMPAEDLEAVHGMRTHGQPLIPVSPPIRNSERNPQAKSIGEANESRPPYIVASQLKNLIPVGIETSKLAATNHKSAVRLIPVVNM